MEPLVLLAEFLNPLERFPVTPAGTVNITAHYIARNHRTRSSLEKRGVPASSIPRLPPGQDETVARTTDGEVADLASPEFQRAVAAINALNETQWAMVNNDLMAMISSLVDTSQLADSHELSSQSSGLILYANLRMQMLLAAPYADALSSHPKCELYGPDFTRSC